MEINCFSPVPTRQVERLFARYAEAAGLLKLKRHPHVLKHPCGVQLIASAPVHDVQRWMGHKNSASTLEYLNHSDEEATPPAYGRWQLDFLI